MSNIKEKNINSDVPPRLLNDNERDLGNGTIFVEGNEKAVTNPDDIKRKDTK